jgi:hypothetical protein
VRSLQNPFLQAAGLYHKYGESRSVEGCQNFPEECFLGVVTCESRVLYSRVRVLWWSKSTPTHVFLEW